MALSDADVQKQVYSSILLVCKSLIEHVVVLSEWLIHGLALRSTKTGQRLRNEVKRTFYYYEILLFFARSSIWWPSSNKRPMKRLKKSMLRPRRSLTSKRAAWCSSSGSRSWSTMRRRKNRLNSRKRCRFHAHWLLIAWSRSISVPCSFSSQGILIGQILL